MPARQFITLVAIAIVAGGLTIAAFAGHMGSPILPILALVAALVGLVLGRQKS